MVEWQGGPTSSRIDRFLISNYLLMQLAGLSQKVLNRPVSDHFLICLDPRDIMWGSIPFRLDNKWLLVGRFKDLVSNCWQNMVVEGINSFKFGMKLKTLKNEIKKWAKEEEGKVARASEDYLDELGVLDKEEMDGRLGEHGRKRKEEIRKRVAELMNMEVVSWK